MRLEEAREVLHNFIKQEETYLTTTEETAIKLAIEALKRIKKSRGDATRYYIGYLPGETKEQK